MNLSDLSETLKNERQSLLNLDKKITGFNVGVNAGKDAGQSIMHCHIHLIPRRKRRYWIILKVELEV